MLTPLHHHEAVRHEGQAGVGGVGGGVAASGVVMARSSDRNQPMNIQADTTTYNANSGTTPTLLNGNVVTADMLSAVKMLQKLVLHACIHKLISSL